MKSLILLSVILFGRQTLSTGYPALQYDPDTVKDCVEWWNNDFSQSCEYVRDYFGITPEEFHTWNPSVSLDCKPWDWQSYCIVTETKVNATKPTTTSPKTPSSTTTVATLGPSPTAWTSLGCYVDDPNSPILEQNINPDGDASLTIPKCKNSCYRRSFDFAGVQTGNQCWCSSYVGGEWASNQTSCNTPCTGDKKTFCGGDGLLNVYKAERNQASVVITSGGVGATTTHVVSTSTSKLGVA